MFPAGSIQSVRRPIHWIGLLKGIEYPDPPRLRIAHNEILQLIDLAQHTKQNLRSHYPRCIPIH